MCVALHMCNLEEYPLENRSLEPNDEVAVQSHARTNSRTPMRIFRLYQNMLFKRFTENAALLFARLNVQDVIDAREKTISCKRPFDAARILQSKSHPMGICPIVRKLS